MADDRDDLLHIVKGCRHLDPWLAALAWDPESRAHASAVGEFRRAFLLPREAAAQESLKHMPLIERAMRKRLSGLEVAAALRLWGSAMEELGNFVCGLCGLANDQASAMACGCCGRPYCDPCALSDGFDDVLEVTCRRCTGELPLVDVRVDIPAEFVHAHMLEGWRLWLRAPDALCQDTFSENMTRAWEDAPEGVREMESFLTLMFAGGVNIDSHSEEVSAAAAALGPRLAQRALSDAHQRMHLLDARALAMYGRLPGEQVGNFAEEVHAAFTELEEESSTYHEPGDFANAVLFAMHFVPRDAPMAQAAMDVVPDRFTSAPFVAGGFSATFSADRWGDGVAESEVTTLTAYHETHALSDQRRIFAELAVAKTAPKRTAPRFKQLKASVLRTYRNVGYNGDKRWIGMMMEARREALRALQFPARSADRLQWLKQGIHKLDPLQPEHADLLALLGVHYTDEADADVRARLQTVAMVNGSVLRPRHLQQIRARILRTVPIVGLSGPLRRALAEGRASLELVRREMRNALLRGAAMERLPNPPRLDMRFPTQICDSAFSDDGKPAYIVAIGHDGGSTNPFPEDQGPLVQIVPSPEWIGCWPPPGAVQVGEGEGVPAPWSV